MRLTRRAALAVPLLPLAARAAEPQAAAPIQALVQALLAVMRAGKSAPFTQRYATMGAAVDGAFDLPGIMQTSVGPRWAGLPPDQQAALLTVFRKFTVASYVANFDSYNGEQIELLPESRAVGSDQVVATRIVPRQGDPTRIDYVMRAGPSGWRAEDVLLNGSISQVAVNRSDWRSSLASGAGPLIANLQRKVTDLSAGALS